MARLTPTLAYVLLLFSVGAFAMPEAPPHHALSPELNGLNINTFVKKDRVKIALYVINLEPFDVLCDADYTSGPENQKAKEITIPANKADVFKFTFGRGGQEVVLRLQCLDPREKAETLDSTHDATEDAPR